MVCEALKEEGPMSMGMEGVGIARMGWCADTPGSPACRGVNEEVVVRICVYAYKWAVSTRGRSGR